MLEEKDLLGSIVEVLWDDASFFAQETTEAQWEDRCWVLTWGEVAKVTDNSIFIAGESQVDNGTYRSVTRVPKCGIVGIRSLGKVVPPEGTTQETPSEAPAWPMMSCPFCQRVP